MKDRGHVSVVGHRVGQDYSDLREFFTRLGQPYEWFEAGTPAADELLRHTGLDPATVVLPVLVEDGGAFYESATVSRIVEYWGIRQYPKKMLYDIAIVGAGPAGLSAAVYAASDGLSTLVIERDLPGGQASHTSQIENFFGFPNGIGGAELTGLAVQQAECFGTELIQFSTVNKAAEDFTLEGDEFFELYVDEYGPVSARTLIAASGMEWRTLKLPGLKPLLGRGVYYGAGRAEAAHCRGDDVAVVGAGNSAGQAAMYLANMGASVHMLIRGTGLAASMSDYLAQRILNHPRITMHFETEIVGLEAQEGKLHRLHTTTGMLHTTALFLCLGGVPQTAWAASLGPQYDDGGFLRTGPDLVSPDGTCAVRPPGWELERGPLTLETSIPGFFAAGDARYGSSRRVGGAVGDGAAAVAMAHRVMSE